MKTFLRNHFKQELEGREGTSHCKSGGQNFAERREDMYRTLTWGKPWHILGSERRLSEVGLELREMQAEGLEGPFSG